MDNFTSVIIVSYIPNEERERIFHTSLTSLMETTKGMPVEITVVDMGGNMNVSRWLLDLNEQGKIHSYVRNSSNLSFGLGRNQGYACSYGRNIVVADNDIYYKQGWLENCISFLEKHPHQKIYTSEIEYPTGLIKERYDVGNLDGWNLNMRAGSNCFVMRREDYEAVGGFVPHRIAGTKWCDRACKLGYVCAVSPYGLCEDMALRSGYAHSTPIPFKRVLTNGEEVYLNKDEYKEKHPELNYA